MLQYYEKRQSEYESIYAKPERQKDLIWLETQLAGLVAGYNVLELACGTGYWTRRISSSAISVHATDASSQLAAGAVKRCSGRNVSSGTLDAFEIPKSPKFDCVLAGFFFSHVLIEQQSQFMAGIADAFESGTRAILFDNKYIKGSSTPISRRAVSGDTFQFRELLDGSTHEVLKNFPGRDQLHKTLSEVCRHVVIKESQYFWLASGVLDV